MNWKSEDLLLLNKVLNNEQRIKALENGAEGMKLYRHTVKLNGNNAVDLVNANHTFKFALYIDIISKESESFTKTTLASYFVNSDAVASGYSFDNTGSNFLTVLYVRFNETVDSTEYDLVIYSYKPSSSNYNIKVGGFNFGESDNITLTDSVKEIL